ncbi:autotransporter outer membrane beta-barrel domain-containing protein, partial [Bartonella henselae]|uniref:autotransporter outer membrane beta-barrel domain-containing protein n=1 Tax=Bartonella henselae TaxID=38323 RepID=UPI000961DE25
MIKVFRNHVCLCTVTTAILSFLQIGTGGGASSGEGRNGPYTITVTSLHNGISSTFTPSLSGRINGSLSGLSGENLSGIGVVGGSGSTNSSGELSGSNAGRILSGEGGDESGKYVYKYDRAKGKLVMYNGLYYLCDGCGESTIDNKSYEITNDNASRYPSVAITVKGKGAKVKGEKVNVFSKNSEKSFTRGVSVSEGGKVTLNNLTLKNAKVALHASDGMIEVDGGTIIESQMAVQTIGGKTHVVLNNTKIETNSGKASLYSYGSAEIKMNGGSVDFKDSHGVSSTLDGKVIFDGVSITGKSSKGKSHAVFLMDVGGSVDFKGTISAMNVHGILSENTVSTFNSVPLSEDLLKRNRMTEVNVKSSSVTVEGEGSYGIYFRGEKSEDEKTPSRLEAINLRQTMFSAPDSVALYSTDSTYGVVNLMQSTLSGRSLLRAERGALVKVLASASTLEGGAHVDDRSTAELYLGAGSTWILKQKQERDSRESAGTNDSSISFLLLMNDSSIKFHKLKTDKDYNYQTLRIGKGTGIVYKAQDGAHIYLNTYLNEGGDHEKQKTDRVLIHGDVSGKTTVYVRSMPGSPGGYTGIGGNNQGISLIQVSGKAKEDSFELDGGYVTAQHSPYQYTLYAYGPESDLGKAHPNQRLVKGEEAFWDFRLENRYVTPEPEPGPRPEPEPGPRPEPTPPPRPDPGVKAVVPQVPTYLLLPNALFHSGLMHVGNQAKRLEALRTVSGGFLQSEEKPAFFVRGYGGDYRYTSNLSVLEYGYGGELSYNAVEAGVLLKTIEGEYSNTSFGVIGTYERLSLQPLEVEQSQKSAFDKWSVTAYGGLQCDTDFYLDGLLSYGLFKGDVVTLARGKTAILKGKPLSASVTAGKAFMVGEEGFVLDPQVQAIYQHIQFDKARDIDDFEIELGKLDQWTMRVGGRLTKTFSATDELRVVSLYGKLHLAHSFGKKQSVHF